MNQLPPPTDQPTALSDQDLLQRVRDGDSDAYGVLWSRHAGPAYGVARSFPRADADDLVSEAFIKVLTAIRDGGGPTGAFRPYITMTVRNLARSQFVREPSMLNAEIELESKGTPSSEEVALENYERGVMLEAFSSLQPRWQEVLWHSEVEGLKPREIAAFLGVPANAVSALLMRAKRGLKDAWVTAQLARADTEECRSVIIELGAFARGRLATRAASRVEEHLSTCAKCTRALEEAGNAANLTLMLLPAVAGTAGAAAYAAQSSAPPLPQALVAMGVDPSSADRFRPDTPPSEPRFTLGSRRLVTVGVLLLLLGGGLVSIASLALGARPPAVAESPAPNANAPLAPPGTPAVTPQTTTVPTPTPSQPPTEEQTDDQSTTPAEGRRERGLVPPAGDADGEAPDATSPSDAALGAPVATLSQPDPRMYPVISGSGARAGAAIHVIDETGLTVGSGRARPDGTWSARVTEGDSGPHTLRVRQTDGSATSPFSSEMTYSTLTPPAITAPTDGSTVAARSFTFSFTAPPGTVLQRQISGVTSIFTLTTPSSGAWNERVSVPVGEHSVKVRYANPDSGDVGPWRTIRITAR